MQKKRAIATWIALIFLVMATSGCALIGAAISAGMAYGIYKASNR